jgi:hypothetical protein
MTRTEDYRDKKDGDDADFEPDEKDQAALKLSGTNPLAEEESAVEDGAPD